MAVPSESTLVGRAQDGDIVSFEALVRAYQGLVFRLAQRMLGDRGDAEDVVQDVFVLVWRRLPTLNDPAVFHGWVYQIATRRCLNVLRTRTRHPYPSGVAIDIEVSADPTRPSEPGDDDPSAVAVHAAQLAGLDTVLQTLTDEQRACWVLREMHELSYTEIAYATRLPVATVRGRLARARQNLAKGMASWR